MTPWRLPLAVTPALVVSGVEPTHAQDFSSQYTSAATKTCKQVDAAASGEGDWSIWLCAGIGGYVVRLTEDDLRMTIAIGRDLADAADAPAAKHQFTGFNAVGDTLEWRLFRGQPFATIHRRTLFDAAGAGNPVPYSTLIVTRLNPSCHVALVDVRANAPANANELARQAADAHARDFDCSRNPIVIGKSGRAIALSNP